MIFNLDMIQEVYAKLADSVDAARKLTNKPLTLSEKILYAHLWGKADKAFTRGKDYVDFAPGTATLLRLSPKQNAICH